MCLLPLAQPSGNNITHTERSWCQGQLSCKRWGRWETCIDFSFCWGKQACCGWARVQWARQNVLDCSSSLSLMSCDCWKPPWKQLSKELWKQYQNVFWFFFKSLHNQVSTNTLGNNPPDHITQSKKKLVEKIWQGMQEGNSASITPNRDEPELAIIHHAGLCRAEMLVKQITWCHRSQTHPSSPAHA